MAPRKSAGKSLVARMVSGKASSSQKRGAANAGERPVTTATGAVVEQAPAVQPQVVHIDPDDSGSVDHQISAKRERMRLEKQPMEEGSQKRKALEETKTTAAEAAIFQPEWNIKINQRIIIADAAEDFFLRCMPPEDIEMLQNQTNTHMIHSMMLLRYQARSQSTEIIRRFAMSLRTNNCLREEREKYLADLGELHIAKDKAEQEAGQLRKRNAELEAALAVAEEINKKKRMPTPVGKLKQKG